VLAGIPDPFSMCFTYRLCFKDQLDPAANRILEDIIVDCMQSDFGSASKALLECCFATMLAHLEVFIANYSVQHCIVKKTLAKTTFHGVRLPTLLQWGALVRKDFSDRNAHQAQTCPWTAWRCMYPSNVSSFESAQALSIQQIVAPVHDLQREVHVLKQTLVEVVSMLRDLQNRPAVLSQSPARKRTLESAEDTEVFTTVQSIRPVVDWFNQWWISFHHWLTYTDRFFL